MSDVEHGLAAMGRLEEEISKVQDSGTISSTDDVAPAFIAMVGPPARGKSASFDVLCELYDRRGRLDRVCMLNAGELRRAWETSVKSVDTEDFEFMMRGIVGNRDPAVVRDLVAWKEDSSSGAIPGELFKHVQALNNVFARICWTKGMKMLKDGSKDVCVFDATNTDCGRRDALLDDFRSERLADAGVSFLFLENLCANRRRLFRNFASKLTASKDYRAHFLKYPAAAIEGFVDEFSDSEDDPVESVLLVADIAEKYGGVARGFGLDEDFVILFALHMRDIIMRDVTSYQMKYVPLHTRCPGNDSTIDRLDQSEFYMQVVNRVCSAGDVTVINTNIGDGELVNSFREYVVGSKGADYDNELRYRFVEDDVLAVMAELREISGRMTAPRLVRSSESLSKSLSKSFSNKNRLPAAGERTLSQYRGGGGGSPASGPCMLALALTTVAMAFSQAFVSV